MWMFVLEEKVRRGSWRLLSWDMHNLRSFMWLGTKTDLIRCTPFISLV